MGDGCVVEGTTGNSNSNNNNNNKKKNKKKKNRGGSKKKMTQKQVLAFKLVSEWVRTFVLKLNKLKLPLKWEHVCRFAGNGVAPGRLHVAHAMLEAGYVENLRQALAQYLFDGGPAYSTGSEPLAEEAIKMISHTGDVAVLAHPWALKNPVPIVRRLKEAGLHGMEVYKSDGRLAAYSKLADAYGLLKIGGSDYHGTGGHNESELGSVNLPVIVLHDFLKVARPIWCNAIREILECYAEEPSDSNLATITRFGRTRSFKGGSPLSCGQDLIDHLSSQEMEKCRV
ncbi:Protein trpH [Glycine soja]|uniref:Protein trpH n=2 Tax=Glycine soja TaxID=3848 RepID=A0A0B2SP82_GLYSO|nr:Protein trpH [Glycine soja]